MPILPGRALLCLAIALIVGTLPSSSVSAQVSAEESARKLKPADGLEAALFAAEPMVVNPTSIDVDSRGRVWVCEGLNYRHSLHKGQKKLDDADAIKILEDTDGDGKADKVTVFADKIFPVPMGIAVEEIWQGPTYKGCRVYVGNSPDLLVLEDTDGDDRADRRYPLLTGFGGLDHDHGVHGMTFGPDGKLYLTQGDQGRQVEPGGRPGQFQITDKSGRKVFNDQLGSTLRVNRDGTQFEIIADRQRNDYETCVNAFGQIFTSDNDDDGHRGSRVIWVMDGGRYGYRTPGSPRHWGEDVPGNVPKLVGTGNGSPCGVTVYEGALLPQEYQGSILEAEAGPRTIYAFPVTRKGAAFRTEIKTLLASDDPWFRPVDVATAADGSLFVADWYDAGVGGHAFSDQTTGRIYRVAPNGHAWKPVRPDFGSIAGRVKAQQSPNGATRDVARRLLIADGQAAVPPLTDLFQNGEPIQKARALWLLAELSGPTPAIAALKDDDPQIRELAVRILGRDNRENGQVEYLQPEAKLPPPAQQHLLTLLAVAGDPDPGVRRELILALRRLPTAEVGDALRLLAASWDGQDRWYLEALGLALRHREGDYLARLFNGSLYGPLKLAEAGQAVAVALPPYFPVDRNEAFLSASDPEPPPASALSKNLGLAWQVHRAEVLPLLAKVMPALQSTELQQAADAVLMQVDDPAAAVTLAKLIAQTNDPLRKRSMLATLSRKIDGAWKASAQDPAVADAIDEALHNPPLRSQAVATASATGDPRYVGPLMALVESGTAPPEDRAAAVDAIARLKPPGALERFETLIEKAKARKASDPAAEAAVRNLPRLADCRERLFAMIDDEATPLGLRRAALRTAATLGGGADKLVEMARARTVPSALIGEATAVLHAHPDARIRGEAARLLPITSASGKPLPPWNELIARSGDAGKGREVFFATRTTTAAGSPNAAACGTCHRVQGRGQWVGPDLSTIGSKYGRDELLRSILNPSAAIGYNYVTTVISIRDGQVLTGLMVEDTPEKVVLKSADGRRLSVPTRDVEERAVSEVSLMPEGLAQALTEQELVDLLAFLEGLKRPVSIPGQFQAIGPTAEPIDPLKSSAPGRTWRTIAADAEGRIDLAPIAGPDPGQSAYLRAALTVPTTIDATLVIDTRAEVRAWLAGQELSLPKAETDGARSLPVSLKKGPTELLIQAVGGPTADPAIVVTLVADRPIESAAAGARPAR